MGLRINQEKITPDAAEKLVNICPFSAITYDGSRLDINAGCRLCKLCVNKGPAGAVVFSEDAPVSVLDKDEWRGIAVYADHDHGVVHNVTLELIGKARELAKKINHPVYALIIGNNLEKPVKKLLSYGVDKVFVYDNPELADFKIETYANVFEDFVNKIKPSSVLVGATNVGRSLAPRVAARFRTGLTADCTLLEMKENTDLVQIRPAFGGNIMAQIVNPDHRPQFCTVRYKIFSAPEPLDNPSGIAVSCEVKPEWLISRTVIEKITEKPREADISESEILVAVGRGFKTADDISMARELAELLNANLACTRPLVECGWFDAKQQIGLSGKTVKPKLIITLGISGAVQFAAGMKSSDCIISVNSDRKAAIFDIAHYCVVGDIYRIVPALIAKIKEAQGDVQ